MRFELRFDELAVAEPKIVRDREISDGPLVEDLDAGRLTGGFFEGDVGEVAAQKGGVGGLAGDLRVKSTTPQVRTTHDAKGGWQLSEAERWHRAHVESSAAASGTWPLKSGQQAQSFVTASNFKIGHISVGFAKYWRGQRAFGLFQATYALFVRQP